MRRIVLSLLTLTPAFFPALAGHVWWQARDGSTTGSFPDATWADLQTAITSAQGGSSVTGMVKISGDITRTNSASGQLSVSAGGVVTIGGGWNWAGGSEPTLQDGRSILQANCTTLGNNIRVFNITSSDVTLRNLDIAGGKLTGVGAGIQASGAASRMILENCTIRDNVADTDYQNGGAGIRITGGGGYRISDCIISNNVARNRGWGGGLYLDATTSMIIENSIIAANVASYSSYDGVGGGLALINNAQLFMANCQVIDNRCRGNGSAIYCASANVGGSGGVITAFDCLYTGNRHETDPNGTPVDVLRLAQTSGAGASRFVNCTVASNYAGRVTAGAQASSGHFIGLHTLNSIIEAGRLNASGGDSYGNNAATAHWALQNSTVQTPSSSTSFGMAAWVASAWQWSYTNTLEDALTAVDLGGTNRFHSLNDANIFSQALEKNLEGDPGFIGPLNPHSRPAFSLIDSSTSKDSGLTRTGSGYTYVDVNANGSYNALVDVIVAGIPPGGTHHVYTKDLAGNPRLKGNIIDRGCYELQPAKGTVVIFK